jgi:hypothetical protein
MIEPSYLQGFMMVRLGKGWMKCLSIFFQGF